MPGPLLLLFVCVTIVCSQAEHFLSEEGICAQCSGSVIKHRRCVYVCVCLCACLLRTYTKTKTRHSTLCVLLDLQSGAKKKQYFAVREMLPNKT